MKQRQKFFTFNRYTISILSLALILAATFGVVILRHNTTDAAPSPKTTIAVPVSSQFSFTGATGWWKGATNETSIALFSNDQSCFTSIQHNTGTVNVATALQKTQTSLTTNGYRSTLISTLTATLQTGTTRQSYQLYQYSVASPAGVNKVEGGQEFGYVQLSNSYLEVQGNCNTAAELTTTIPALQAITFSANN